MKYDYQRILFLYRVFYFGVNEEMYSLELLHSTCDMAKTGGPGSQCVF